jgi:hypothetical protein
VVATRHAQLEAVEADLAAFIDRLPFAGQVARLAAYRGVTRLGGLTLAAEVCDWRRFGRAAQFMGFCGLVPSEYSSGSSVHRGRLTKAGNAHLRAQLIESAWTYRHRPYVGREIPGRQHGLDPEVIAPGLGRAAALVGPVLCPRRPQEHQEHRGRRHRPRAGRVLVGGDGRLTNRILSCTIPADRPRR